MKFLVILSLVVVAVLAAPAEEIDPFVVGGVNALPGEFPFIVSLQRVVLQRTSHVCGGSILNNIWILSAAHCLTETPTTGRLEVVAGLHNLATGDGSVRLGVDRPRSIIHPDWVAGERIGPDDLALIRLSAPLTYNVLIQPIRLPQPSAVPTGPGILSGWGATSGSSTTSSNILQKAILSTISIADCRTAISSLNFNGNLVTNSNFCTGPLTGGLSACAGDFGGPFIQGAAPNQVLVGVVSWGISPCGTRGAPSAVFKRVSAYNAWIESSTGIRA